VIPARRSPHAIKPGLVVSESRALIALPSWVRVSPRKRFGRLSFEDFMETASLGMALEA
jgi:hypothetical protein